MSRAHVTLCNSSHVTEMYHFNPLNCMLNMINYRKKSMHMNMCPYQLQNNVIKINHNWKGILSACGVSIQAAYRYMIHVIIPFSKRTCIHEYNILHKLLTPINKVYWNDYSFKIPKTGKRQSLDTCTYSVYGHPCRCRMQSFLVPVHVFMYDWALQQTSGSKDHLKWSHERLLENKGSGNYCWWFPSCFTAGLVGAHGE